MAREIDLNNYLPPILKDYKELKAIQDALTPEVNMLWRAIEDSLNDQFIESSTENGVKRREKPLNIIPKATDTLEERKFRLLVKENEKLPYTYRVLKQRIETLCGLDGYSFEVKYNEYIVKVRVVLTAKSNLDEVDKLLDNIVPENMIIDLSLAYNQHLYLSKFTHAQLKAYTHNQLRMEVLT